MTRAQVEEAFDRHLGIAQSAKVRGAATFAENATPEGQRAFDKALGAESALRDLRHEILFNWRGAT
jgi:hypothetical protein